MIEPDSRYNIAPSQSVAVVTNEHAEPRIDFARWGLVPQWARDGSVTAGSRMINARAETLASKPAFSRLLMWRRCLIPADGFFEWQKTGKTKTPWRFQLKNARPFAFAGLWDQWQSPDGQLLKTCTIITTSANALVASVHNRMPAMLDDANCRRWVNAAEQSIEAVAKMLEPYPASEMIAFPVSSAVNSPAKDESAMIEPAAASDSVTFQLELF
jgi:putative SOS response-associated peptidase YedK